MINNVFVTIILGLGAIASIIALLNTQIILRDLSKIKTHLGIKEEKKSSFLIKDLNLD